MKFWDKFRTVKERGEWVELQFMAEAARRRFGVSRPWGSIGPYDVGIEHGAKFLRVQVKSTAFQLGRGYWCQFKPNQKTKVDYSLRRIDVFAAYVIPMDVWYLIPRIGAVGYVAHQGDDAVSPGAAGQEKQLLL